MSLRKSLRLLLIAPSEFFAEHEPSSTLALAGGLVVIYALSLVAALFALGSMLSGTLDATIIVDNPNRPPDHICDGFGDSDMPGTEGCDEPREVERDASALVTGAMHDIVPYALVGPFVLWLVSGGVLYLFARLAAGTPSFSGALALSGWAVLPEFARLAVGLLAIRYSLADVTITNPERAPEVIEAALASVEPVLLGASVLTTGWQWFLLTGGLHHDANLRWKTAAVAVGVPLGLFFLLTVP